jgi:hypothetical protein
MGLPGNSDFYADFFGDLHTAWSSVIAPGPQIMTVTASAAGYTTATVPLTVAVTGTLAPRTMVVTPAQVATTFDNSPTVTIVYSLTVSQTKRHFGEFVQRRYVDGGQPSLCRRDSDDERRHLPPDHDMDRPNRRWPTDRRSYGLGAGVYHRGSHLDDCCGRLRQSDDDDWRQRVE